MIKVKFIRAWQFYHVGDVIEPAGMLRDWLVQMKFVEVLRDPAPIENATLEPAERAVPEMRPKRRRGRPPKRTEVSGAAVH